MTALTFTVAGTDRTIEVTDFDLVVAGYTGRDEAEVRKHIDELAAIGVPPPDSVPAFYELDPALTTQSATVPVAGANTSGEVEPVLVRVGGRLYLTVGSDHTDRDIETRSVAESKAACPKPVGTAVVPVDAPDWDAITAESTVDGVRYQAGALRALRIPTDVLALRGGPAHRDLVLFCGTLPLLGGTFVAGTRWELSLALPGGVTLTHAYSVS
jgi:4-hydroxyphenylacetate 3-monooxygenase